MIRTLFKFTVMSLAVTAFSAAMPSLAHAEIRTSSIFSDSMVLQRDKPIRVWGWTDAGSEATVTLAENSVTGTANEDGRFEVSLPAMPAGGPHELSISSGDQTKTFTDVLIGEVWICSGQSNMAWPVNSANDADLEKMTAKYPNIRLISVPQVGTQEPQDDFNGQWQACTPETVPNFSAVGYFFGRQLHQTLDVPIGLIDNAWGGSAAEAWVRRDVLEQDGKYDELLQRWDERAKTYDHEAAMADYRERLAKWQTDKKGNRPAAPRNDLVGQHRPANLYNGVLKPTIGYTVRGVIWYQGESNAGRAYQYRDLFPLMIQSWREEWGQGDFSFYWVQLADFMNEVDEPADSDWAELREAQTMTLALPNTGQAVIVDLGEAADIHPRNKQDVALRLSRLALAKDYAVDVQSQSPTYQSMEVDGDRIRVTFDDAGGDLDTFDVKQPVGFTIAGDDQKFVPAEAQIVDEHTIEVWSKQVKQPVAVRYAWADNPIANVQNTAGLPMTPFRTDQWKGVTEGVVK
ncbi:sialate O-acetylesterase [Stieleria varia]|uniref:Sialate O-acetylesterase domain-containing protein n=1 Tax=Stieleria varia TaxID=2528005 RepID=A0A5C6B670_9BACT|nr:sialate O-acetylesterase [Stieleria varia]TWU07450.1 hypothetical protein Pla52n_00230 [Stieleria varia]